MKEEQLELFKEVNGELVPANPVINVPAEIEALFDEANESGPYGAVILDDRVQLVDRDMAVIREVKWDQAGQYRRNLLGNILPSE